MGKIDMDKRRRIMQRSMKLGHCICDPRRLCPCDVFKNEGVCLCAGERRKPSSAEPVRLTRMVHNAGCASKISPTDLEAVLSRLPAVEDPAVLSGISAGDDAGIYKLGDNGTCLVQTVDVMTPCVDDPYTFGRICAANCLSDIYAMGGRPLTALSILCFPAETHDREIMYHMMKGAMDVLAQARVALLGGHSVKDEEIKLGFAITGLTDQASAARHDTARVGDVLVLTKPLGTGVLSFCRQIGRAGDFAAVEASMATLNKAAAEAMNEVGASACTDVTGFGLFGHLISMCRHSGVTAQIFAAALPAFDGALEALREGVVPGGIERNMEYVGGDLRVEADVEEARVHLGFDPQTSGGLLIAVPRDRYGCLARALAKRNIPAATVGRIVEQSDGLILVTQKAIDVTAQAVGLGEQLRLAASDTSCCSGDSSCCGPTSSESQTMTTDKSPVPPGDTTNPQVQKAFGAYLKAAFAGGTIDAKTKELINYALVVMSRCTPCVETHRKLALEMGLTPEQLDEAAWLAAFMGGAPVRMFYMNAMKSIEGKAAPEPPAPCCGH